MLYLQLFISFFKIGLFGFGGGMAIFSLIQLEVVGHGWLTPEEVVDIMAVSQVTPGPIGINCATYVGYTIGGFWGSVLATSALVLPSLIIMLSICKTYFWLSKRFQGNPYFEQTLRMLRFTVIGLIAAAALMLIKPTNFIDTTSWIIFAIVAFFTILPEFIKKEIKIFNFPYGEADRSTERRLEFSIFNSLSHPILLILLAGLAGYCIYS